MFTSRHRHAASMRSGFRSPSAVQIPSSVDILAGTRFKSSQPPLGPSSSSSSSSRPRTLSPIGSLNAPLHATSTLIRSATAFSPAKGSFAKGHSAPRTAFHSNSRHLIPSSQPLVTSPNALALKLPIGTKPVSNLVIGHEPDQHVAVFWDAVSSGKRTNIRTSSEQGLPPLKATYVSRTAHHPSYLDSTYPPIDRTHIHTHTQNKRKISRSHLVASSYSPISVLVWDL